ncbi:hypothetical protein VNO78_10109 [Psophocarpus tetragonolobus]|uniref:Uncharacterized protein n=1 Tax=Psophocarpus tetragonolobus TaxID=3891 RepID=A0AAN9XMF8_PSOTE
MDPTECFSTSINGEAPVQLGATPPSLVHHNFITPIPLYYICDHNLVPQVRWEDKITHVEAKLANEEVWWYKLDYIINELNINSIITMPFHDEILPINSLTTRMPYILRGYTYFSTL